MLGALSYPKTLDSYNDCPSPNLETDNNKTMRNFRVRNEINRRLSNTKINKIALLDKTYDNNKNLLRLKTQQPCSTTHQKIHHPRKLTISVCIATFNFRLLRCIWSSKTMKISTKLTTSAPKTFIVSINNYEQQTIETERELTPWCV